MKILTKLFAALALVSFGLASPAMAEKPLVYQSGKIKQLPASTTIQLNASGTGAASINIPAGTAPTSPTNGDCWTTTAGLYCRINGATVGPYATATDDLVIQNFIGLANAADTINVNSTSYADIGSLAFHVDLDRFLFTDFRIIVSASSNQAAQTITAELTVIFGGAAIHTGGNDLSITNSFGVFDSGWRSRDAGASSGLGSYGIMLKGSNSTVDLAINSMTIMLRK